ncbi:MAG: polymerase subunit delta [Solirubrobacterales bacterium]|nr:polymerase subunit delta [Solirubrobacterales bacterium]
MSLATPAEPSELSAALEDATSDQPHAAKALAGGLASGALHAYLFHGPRGTGKRAAARAFAAELLAQGSEDPDSARRRALADPSPHPDLVWLRPAGSQHLVGDVREQVIHAAALRPFEGERRVFVIESADAMQEESQNALLKTLEEPPSFAHLLLLSAEPELIAETVRSRCQPIAFAPLSPEAVERRLAGADAGSDERRAVARLSGGDADLAALLLSDPGRRIRDIAEALARAACADDPSATPWRPLLEVSETIGNESGAIAEAELLERAETAPKSEAARRKREAGEAARRVSRRERTATLDLALALCGAWYRDLASVAAGAPELVLNADRTADLEADAAGLAPARAREAVELTLDTRQRLRLNVAEELALEALFFRLQDALA